MPSEKTTKEVQDEILRAENAEQQLAERETRISEAIAWVHENASGPVRGVIISALARQSRELLGLKHKITERLADRQNNGV